MFRRLLVGLVALFVIVGCGGSDDSTAPSATVARPDSTSTSSSTSSVPQTPEEEVEAAVIELPDRLGVDLPRLEVGRLEEVYARRALELVRSDVRDLRTNNTPVRCDVEHDYEVDVGGPRFASVLDHYVNHCVLLDPETGQPAEDDPNEVVSELYLLENFEGTWKVIGIQDA